jgi:hypothetical protein
VDHERAAAALIPGHEYLATFRSQDASSGGVDLRKKDVLHASQQ